MAEGAPETGKLRVFISYSRDDLDFADQLFAALALYGYDPTMDRHGISGGEDWKLRLGSLIREADTVVFVLSPSSAQSPICAWEVEEAARLAKRILPVVCRPLEGASAPQRLQNLNYIFFYPDEESRGTGFGTGLANLVAALNTDLDWLREHTRLLQRAIEWDAAKRVENRMLSGGDIAEAKAWAARRPTGAPEPTALHLDFIRASEAAEQARLSAEGRRLAEMAAAQEARSKALADAEAALKREAEAQQGRARARRIITWGSAAAVVILAAVAAFAGVQWRHAVSNAREAVLQRTAAEQEKRKAEAQERTALKEKERAETALDAVRELVSDFAPGLDLQGTPRPVIRSILTHAHRLIDTLASTDETRPERDLATSLERIADLQLAESDRAGALANYAKALIVLEKLAAADPANTQWQRELSFFLSKIAEVFRAAGDQAEALRLYDRSLAFWERLAALDPLNARWQRGLAFGLERIASIRRDRGDRAGALPLYERSLAIYEKLAAAEPLNPQWQRGSAIGLERIGSLRRDAGGRAGALPFFERSLAIYEKLAAADPLNSQYQRGSAIALERIGGIRRDEGDRAGALPFFERSLAIYEKLAAAEPLDTRWQLGSAIALERIGGIRRDEGDRAGALAAYEKLLPLQEKVAAMTEEDETKSSGGAGPKTAGQLHGVAWVALFVRDFAKALAASERAHALSPDSLTIETNRAHALLFLDRGDEAKVIYMAHKGKKFLTDDKPWEQAIAEDFAQLRKAGLDHAMMAETLAALGDSPAP